MKQDRESEEERETQSGRPVWVVAAAALCITEDEGVMGGCAVVSATTDREHHRRKGVVGR